MTIDYEDFATLVRARRTHMLVDRDEPVDPSIVEALCELATWAPNHKRTHPWRFATCTSDGRLRLGEAFVADMVDRNLGDEGKRAKTLTKYARTPTVLVVGCAANDHPTFHDENRDAVSAGIQNLLLGATALGLASFWSTAPIIDAPRALDLCGFSPDDRIIGIIYLGWATGTAEAGERPTLTVNAITS